MKMLRLKHVIAMTGLSRATIWRMEREGKFPTRRQIGRRAVAWLESDVLNWAGTRPKVSNRATA